MSKRRRRRSKSLWDCISKTHSVWLKRSTPLLLQAITLFIILHVCCTHSGQHTNPPTINYSSFPSPPYSHHHPGMVLIIHIHSQISHFFLYYYENGTRRKYLQDRNIEIIHTMNSTSHPSKQWLWRRWWCCKFLRDPVSFLQWLCSHKMTRLHCLSGFSRAFLIPLFSPLALKYQKQ